MSETLKQLISDHQAIQFDGRAALQKKTNLQRRLAENKTSQQRVAPYIVDLLARLGEDDDEVITHCGVIHYKAMEELETLKDESLIDVLKELLSKRQSAKNFGNLVKILQHITKNTHSINGKISIVTLLEKDCLRRVDEHALIGAAIFCKVKDASSQIKRIFKASGEPICLDYFSSIKDASAVELIIEKMAEGEKLWLPYIFALANIGSAQAVPTLLAIARRQFTSRKQQEREWRFYSIYALGKISSRRVVPALIELSLDTKYKHYHDVIVHSLCLIADVRAIDSVIKILRECIEEGVTATTWSAEHRTILVNGFDYFIQIGKQDLPIVHQLLSFLQHRIPVNNLLEEERQFLNAQYGLAY